MNKHCFHCGEVIQIQEELTVTIHDKIEFMCCIGCQAVASTIVASGLTSYYQYRTAPAGKSNIIPDELNAFTLYDHAEIQQEFVRCSDEYNEILLSIEGVSCSACAWLIERKLSQHQGVAHIQVNTTTQRASLRWHAKTTSLSALIHEIHQLGYQAAPFEVDAQESQYQQTMKQYLYRLGIAGIATMQVMMLAFAMYFEVLGDMDETLQTYLRWISLLFTTPVLLYSANPFYRNAWHSLKAKTLVMDVPVSIALLFAYFASCYATITGQGEVFFESIAMFTFFLLIGRYLEIKARRTAAAMSANQLKLIPKLARLTSGEQVPIQSLKIDQEIRVLPGESCPADGLIISGQTSMNESMMTGEPLPIHRKIGDQVYAGTINIDGHIDIRVTAEKKDALISRILHMQNQAQAEKPRIAQIADVIARYFICIILIIASGTWWYWHQLQPDDAFWIMLSVLVATCPCALSLATPTALTCATSTLSHLGLLLKRGHVFETLTKVNHIILDKTGTLTEGKISIAETQVYTDIPLHTLLSYAQALESHSSHPIAKAFLDCSLIKGLQPKISINQVENVIGSGLSGVIEQDEWRIGKFEFAVTHPLPEADTKHQIWLSRNGEAVASFFLIDPIRASSLKTVQAFQSFGIQVTMLTGDNSPTAFDIAKRLRVNQMISGVSPQGKLDYLKSLPFHHITLMIGDGVNDALVLAGAHLSVAMGSGTDHAKSSADMILLGDDLSKLLIARKLARHTQKIIQQNLAWALSYNLFILPLAVMGYVAPYIAVIGMSASSVIVVTNSLRLARKDLLAKLRNA